ncbi:MAG: rhomboid family intramembrane serine protease [Flavipsychrobacter sp.]|nr:rhomboid family intramembrane serine protease [Flavipsychrobacter sp.]
MQRTSGKYSNSPFVRYYQNNAVLQLIVALSSAFVLFHFTITIMRIMRYPEQEILDSVVAYTTLPALAALKWKVWTVLTYGLFHMKQGVLSPEPAFWAMFSNMLWLYAFGSVVQMLIGHRHIMPMFFYCVVMGGIVYLLVQYVPGLAVPAGRYIGGAQAGITGMAAASLTIAPRYRFYLTPHFSIPLYVVGIIFGVLMFLYSGMQVVPLLLIAGGGLSGVLYVLLLRRGYNLAELWYSLFRRVGNTVTPREEAYKKHHYRRDEVENAARRQKIQAAQRVDDILDKINRKGYNSLTQEEKDILLRASKESD